MEPPGQGQGLDRIQERHARARESDQSIGSRPTSQAENPVASGAWVLELALPRESRPSQPVDVLQNMFTAKLFNNPALPANLAGTYHHLLLLLCVPAHHFDGFDVVRVSTLHNILLLQFVLAV